MADLIFDQSVWADFMQKCFRDARAAAIPRALSASDAAEFYGFRCADVEMVYFHKQGEGEGCWFRLKDGRVVSWNGLPSTREPVFYVTATTH